MSQHSIEVTVNGQTVRSDTEARVTLADFLRDTAGCTGVHLGCEHGVCGACTVMVDGKAVRSCLMFAVQADGAAIRTTEGLAAADGTLHPVQQAMRDHYALQCGFCTPGIVMTFVALTDGGAHASEEELREAASGHLCRCTGYQGMIKVARALAAGASA